MESFGPNNCLIPEFIISKTISDDFQGYKKALNQIYISKLICPILGPQNLGSEFQGQIDENPLILNDCSRFLKKLCRYLENLFRRIFKHFILLFQGHRN